MLAKFIILILLVTFSLFGKSYLFSPIPAVNNEVFEIDISQCDEECQLKLLEEEKPFSFISKYNKKTDNDKLKNSYQELKAVLNLDEEEDASKTRIAVLVPSTVIGRYASMVTDAVNAYLLQRNEDFTLQVYDSKNESTKALKEQIEQVLTDGHRYVIAPLTASGAENLARLNLPLQVFIPTISKDDVTVVDQNIIYGGINYKKQIKDLLAYQEGNRTVIFDEPIELSKKLTSYAQEVSVSMPETIELKTRRTKFKDLFEKLDLDTNTTLLLNTRPVMTSLILSQLTYNEVNISRVVTTQLNYTPVVLRLTQSQDLEKLLVANSISKLNDKVYESNKLFNNDIAFNWIIYSTTIMSDMIYQRTKRDFSSKSKLFNVPISDNAIDYGDQIFAVKNKKFIKAEEPIVLDTPLSPTDEKIELKQIINFDN